MKLSPQTLTTRTYLDYERQNRPLSMPLSYGTTYTASSAEEHATLYQSRAPTFYQRFGHPSSIAVADKVAALELIHLNDGRRQLLHSSIGRTYGATWSPDGRSIAFNDAPKGDEDDADIFVIDIASQKVRQLTNNPAWDRMPQWRPDGQALLFTSYRTEEKIYELDMDSSSIRPLCETGIECASETE